MVSNLLLSLFLSDTHLVNALDEGFSLESLVSPQPVFHERENVTLVVRTCQTVRLGLNSLGSSPAGSRVVPGGGETLEGGPRLASGPLSERGAFTPAVFQP